MWSASLDSCSPNLTASSQRVCARFESCCTGNDLNDLGHLVFALLAEESIGGACLHRLGLTMEVLATGSLGTTAADSASRFLADTCEADVLLTENFVADSQDDQATSIPVRQPATWNGPNWYIVLRDRASIIAKKSQDGPSISSEHLVIAMTAVNGFVKQVLEQHGIRYEDVKQSLDQNDSPVETLNVDLTLLIDDEAQTDTPCGPPSTVSAVAPANRTVPAPWEQTVADDHAATDLQSGSNYDHRVHALLDANLNRAREGLRVLEDCARFILCCVSTTERLKNVRHQLVEAELRLRARHPLIQRRDVEADAGTGITTANEQRRANLRDIITANCRRMQEAIRSLEEFGKLIDGQFSEACKQLRYQTYQAEQMLENRMSLSDSNTDDPPAAVGRTRQQRQSLLSNSHLYVLMTEQFCSQPWKQTAEAVLVAGADILQLREKQLAKSELHQRAAWLRDLCVEHDSLFFMNDDAQLAQNIDADGVHVGQTDLPVNDVRQMINQDQLIGLSTHNLNQLQGAAKLNVDYVGVGPMFSTNTKSFDQYSGPNFATEASENTALPWFAIGGIEQGNLSELIDAGVRRIAVCGAVLAATSPAQATGQLKQQLLAAGAAD